MILKYNSTILHSTAKWSGRQVWLLMLLSCFEGCFLGRLESESELHYNALRAREVSKAGISYKVLRGIGLLL